MYSVRDVVLARQLAVGQTEEVLTLGKRLVETCGEAGDPGAQLLIPCIPI